MIRISITTDDPKEGIESVMYVVAAVLQYIGMDVTMGTEKAVEKLPTHQSFARRLWKTLEKGFWGKAVLLDRMNLLTGVSAIVSTREPDTDHRAFAHAEFPDPASSDEKWRTGPPQTLQTPPDLLPGTSDFVLLPELLANPSKLVYLYPDGSSVERWNGEESWRAFDTNVAALGGLKMYLRFPTPEAAALALLQRGMGPCSLKDGPPYPQPLQTTGSSDSPCPVQDYDRGDGTFVDAPIGNNPNYDNSLEAELTRIRNGRDRARQERDVLQWKLDQYDEILRHILRENPGALSHITLPAWMGAASTSDSPTTIAPEVDCIADHVAACVIADERLAEELAAVEKNRSHPKEIFRRNLLQTRQRLAEGALTMMDSLLSQFDASICDWQIDFDADTYNRFDLEWIKKLLGVSDCMYWPRVWLTPFCQFDTTTGTILNRNDDPVCEIKDREQLVHFLVGCGMHPFPTAPEMRVCEEYVPITKPAWADD